MSAAPRQRGMVLILALVALLVLAMVTVGAANLAGQQQRMAFASQRQAIAFQAAESGLRYARANRLAPGSEINLEIIHKAALSSFVARAKVRVGPAFPCVEPLEPGAPVQVCYALTSLAKACADLNACDVEHADGQARALHKSSTPPGPDLGVADTVTINQRLPAETVFSDSDPAYWIDQLNFQ